MFSHTCLNMPITGGSYTQHDIPENGRNSPSVLENDRSSSGNSSDSEQKNDTKFWTFRIPWEQSYLYWYSLKNYP